jgi:hypothetical protein
VPSRLTATSLLAMTQERFFCDRLPTGTLGQPGARRRAVLDAASCIKAHYLGRRSSKETPLDRLRAARLRDRSAGHLGGGRASILRGRTAYRVRSSRLSSEKEVAQREYADAAVAVGRGLT